MHFHELYTTQNKSNFRTHIAEDINDPGLDFILFDMNIVGEMDGVDLAKWALGTYHRAQQIGQIIVPPTMAFLSTEKLYVQMRESRDKLADEIRIWLDKKELRLDNKDHILAQFLKYKVIRDGLIRNICREGA